MPDAKIGLFHPALLMATPRSESISTQQQLTAIMIKNPILEGSNL